MKEQRVLCITGFEFPEPREVDRHNGNYGLRKAELAEKTILGIAELVNYAANTDHRALSCYPLTYEEGISRFKKGNCGALIGYMFDCEKREVHLALKGRIDPDVVLRELKKRGYNVREVDRLPGISISGYSRMRGGIHGELEKQIAEEQAIAERLAIKIRDLKPKTCPETIEIRRKLRQGEIAEEEAERLLAKIALKQEGVI